MQVDTIPYDSIAARPLPKWLIDQRDGTCTIEPEKNVIKEDRSLQMSLTFTAVFVFVVIVAISLYIVLKPRK